MIQGDEGSSASLSAPPLSDLLSSEIEAPCLVSTSEDEESNNKEDGVEEDSKRTERDPQLIDVIFRSDIVYMWIILVMVYLNERSKIEHALLSKSSWCHLCWDLH